MISSMLPPSVIFCSLFVGGVLAHLLADWFMQNEWMSVNKTNPAHPAGYVHAVLHFVCLLAIFPAYVALALGISHFFIDLRTPLIAWRKLIRQTNDPSNPVMIPLAMCQDQAAHILLIGLAAYLCSHQLLQHFPILWR